MKNKNIYIGVGVVVVVTFLVIYFIQFNSLDTNRNPDGITNESSSKDLPSTKTTAKPKVPAGTPVVEKTPSGLPEIDFINQRLVMDLKDQSGVKLTIEKVVFGRGEVTVATGCSGIPNATFSTYFYPGSGVCINQSNVDGVPTGIVAFHILVENNSNFGFGGKSDALKLHYLRSDSSGKPVHRFALPLNGLGAYYINGYSSKSIILSYLVPEDQLIYDLVAGYKEPALEDRTLNVYDFSTNGFQVNFTSKALKLVK